MPLQVFFTAFLFVATTLALVCGAGCGESTGANQTSRRNTAEQPALSGSEEKVTSNESRFHAGTVGEGSTLPGASGEPGGNALAHRRFVLTILDGTPYHGGEFKPDLEFGEGMSISGRACNFFTGQAELRSNMLVARHLAFTRMLCPDEGLNRLEKDLVMMFEKGVEYTLRENSLVLRGEGRELVYEAVRQAR